MANATTDPLDHDTCYRAMRTRDIRFDGRFFTGVRTTGIYCRPVCPARTPKTSNVTFYACAAAAEEAGFRPCKRCRPETAPGTPAWLGTSATVTRALRLIAQGALDREASVDTLADRLGITARHLRRLFEEHLGASPIAIAQARRVHFARSLLEGSDIPMTEVAYASGFSSVRQFNTAFSRTFRQAPREIRRETLRQSAKPTHAGERVLELHLSYREPYDYEALLSFLSLRATPGVECVDAGSYRRTVRFDDKTGVIEVARDASASRLLLRIPGDLSFHALEIAERIRRLFDLSADSRVIEEQLSADPLLRPLVRRFSGTRVPGSWDGFETAVRAVVGQQVSVKGATTVSGRIATAYGAALEARIAGCDRLSPTPANLARLRAERVGLTRARATTLRALARATARAELRFDAAMELDDALSALQKLPGIGPWSAHYIAMRAFGEPDAFPSGDLILRRVAAELDAGLERKGAFEAHAESWRPWRAYAAMMLWRQHNSNPIEVDQANPRKRNARPTRPTTKRRVRA